MSGEHLNRALSGTLSVLAATAVVGMAIQSAAAGTVATPGAADGATGPAEAALLSGHSGPTTGNVVANDGVGDVDFGNDGVTLTRSVLREQRGDVVVLTFEFHGRANEAKVRLGAADAVGYEVRFAVRDGDGDGRVVVLWNTARSHTPTAGLSVWPLSGSGDDSFSQGPNVVEGTAEPVEPAAYPVSVAWNGFETDVGTVFVGEPSANDLTVHTAPASVPAFETIRAVERTASDAAAGRTIAVGERTTDWVVLRLDASGLAGRVLESGDFDDATGPTLTITETDESVDLNEDPVRMRLADNATLLADRLDDRYYLAFRASRLLAAGGEVGDQFTATFSRGGDGGPETVETLSATFSLVEGRASADLVGGELLAGAREEARITGTTTWAPGTEFLVQLHVTGSTGNGSAFAGQNDGVVAGDGTWAATFDLSGQVPSQAADVTLFHRNTSVMLARASGELGNLSASVQFDSQVAEDEGTLVVVESVTLAQGGFVAIHEGGPDGPVVGTSRALDAGTHEDVRIRLDADATLTDETTLAAVAHLDSDDNGQFGFVVTGGAVDRPYVVDGSVVADQVTVYAEPPLASNNRTSRARA